MTWEYIAGFFDGEGTLAHNGRGFRVVIPQTHKDVLEQITVFARTGHVVEVTKRQPHWKDAWVFYIAKQEDVLVFLRRIRPFLIVKKEKVERALPQLESSVMRLKTNVEVRRRRHLHARRLRMHGLTFRRISRIVGLEWSYVRRVLLRSKIHGGRSSIG